MSLQFVSVVADPDALPDLASPDTLPVTFT